MLGHSWLQALPCAQSKRHRGRVAKCICGSTACSTVCTLASRTAASGSCECSHPQIAGRIIRFCMWLTMVCMPSGLCPAFVAALLILLGRKPARAPQMYIAQMYPAWHHLGSFHSCITHKLQMHSAMYSLPVGSSSQHAHCNALNCLLAAKACRFTNQQHTETVQTSMQCACAHLHSRRTRMGLTKDSQLGCRHSDTCFHIPVTIPAAAEATLSPS